MTTLVTGATGFVGSHVARLLVNQGTKSVSSLENVVIRTSSPTCRSNAPWAISAMQLRSSACAESAAFFTSPRITGSGPRPEEIYESNVGGTRKLLDAAQRAGVERIVYTSTVATIAVPRHGSLPNETTQSELGEMIGHYKRSKFMAEQVAIRAACEGVPVVIVNPTAPIGPCDWKPTPTGKIILDFLNGKMPAYVDTGLNVVAVEDVAAGHLLAAEKGRIGERYILGARNLTLKQILDCSRQSPAVRLRA